VSLEHALIRQRAARLERVKEYTVDSSDEGFEKDQFAEQAPLTLFEDAVVSTFFLAIMGGPLLLSASFFVLLLLGSWTQLATHIVITLALAFHPVPKASTDNAANPFVIKLSRMVYRYFTYRYMWSGDAWEKVRTGPAWIGASPPHGALPIANLLCMPSINLATRPFVGAPASIVFHTPFLRYIFFLGSCEVSSKPMVAAVHRGECVGMVPDGIAGIFTVKQDEEVVALKTRKGLARLMLRTGTPVLPAYSLGNTKAFGCWFDSFGIMEWLSRKVKASLFIPYGRYGLPIPFRCNITMIFGEPIIVEQVENPTQEQIDVLHLRLLDAWQSLFETHKSSLGWGKMVLKFV